MFFYYDGYLFMIIFGDMYFFEIYIIIKFVDIKFNDIYIYFFVFGVENI